MEAEVCLLDSSPSPGREGDSQGSLGRGDGDHCFKEVGRDEGAGDGGLGGIHSSQIFFTDATAREAPYGWEPFGLYTRQSGAVLGEEDVGGASSDVLVDKNKARCFNCGSTDHVLASCPERPNSQVISLSRQLFDFLKARDPRRDYPLQRIHVVEEWKTQRLEWVDTFEPGVIKGDLLRGALGDSEGGWLRNIAIWGYPRGWTGEEDPRERVRDRIFWSQCCDEDWSDTDSDDLFHIFGDVAEESVLLNPADQRHSQGKKITAMLSETIASSPAIPAVLESSSSSRPAEWRRWANYPPAYFASHLLPIYNGFTISGPGPAARQDRSAYPRQVRNHHYPPPPPPPPNYAPPPLPPPPPSDPPPPLPPLSDNDPEDEVDMDMSD